MKFYQTIALVILSIMCIAPVLGAKETTKLPYLGEEIYKLIDEFRGTDGVYKEVAHLKPFGDLVKKILGPAMIGTSFIALSTGALVSELFKTLSKKSVF